MKHAVYTFFRGLAPSLQQNVIAANTATPLDEEERFLVKIRAEMAALQALQAERHDARVANRAAAGRSVAGVEAFINEAGGLDVRPFEERVAEIEEVAQTTCAVFRAMAEPERRATEMRRATEAYKAGKGFKVCS